MKETNRVIKFRAWDGGRMLYSDFYHSLAEYFGDVDYEARNPEKEIVMQFTGLHDVKGREIFEKMIINNSYVVEYEPPMFMLKELYGNNKFTFKEVKENEDKIEITKEYSEI